MKYLFCFVALLVQPISAWYMYSSKDKRKAAMKMPMLYLSVLYLVIQLTVFFRLCMRLPDAYQKYAYLAQAVILLVFLLLELALAGSNQYIDKIQEKEQSSIRDFQGLIQELRICRTGMDNEKKQRLVDEVLDIMRYSDPTSAPDVAGENQRIHELILELPEISEEESFADKCAEIKRQLEIRKIKNVKIKG